jgi:hypothetical protein
MAAEPDHLYQYTPQLLGKGQEKSSYCWNVMLIFCLFQDTSTRKSLIKILYYFVLQVCTGNSRNSNLTKLEAIHQLVQISKHKGNSVWFKVSLI